jgi:hypothetical protein
LNRSLPIFLSLLTYCWQNRLEIDLEQGASVDFEDRSETPLNVFNKILVGSTELESVTSCVSSRRSNQLSYEPGLNQRDGRIPNISRARPFAKL